MGSIKREFYEVEEAAQVLEMSVSDLWHLIEVEKIGASFRKAIAQVTYGTEELYDMIACHAYLMNSIDACEVAANGSSLIKYVYLPLLEPREVSIVKVHGNGEEEEIVLVDTYEFSLNTEIEIKKSDIVITQVSIDKYLKASGNSDVLTNMPLSEKERETMVKIIHALAKNGYKYPTRGALSEIINDFELNNNGVSENTLRKYLKEFDSL